MLSRVAENIYWLASYLERAENTARLLIATNHMLLDAPVFSSVSPGSGPARPGQGVDWPMLVTISGSHDLFAKTGKVANEETVTAFMSCERDNPGSILSSLIYARENLRTTRDAFPRKAMEYLNAMVHGFQERMREGLKDEGMRYKALDQVIQDSQKITGLLFSTMSRDSAFEFFRIGQTLERADMTTRILDVGAAGMGNMLRDPTMLPFVNALWLNVLRSLSGEQMYRHHVNPRIRWNQVADFLLLDRQFPRAFRCCLNTASTSLGHLINHEAPRAALKEVTSLLEQADVATMLRENGLPAFIDQLQIRLGELHMAINRTYFSQPN